MRTTTSTSAAISGRESASPDPFGKRVAVIGAGNSGRDIVTAAGS
jgi:NADPH-dependent glutamate synthase beta subunit-like oxidoreductase